MRRLDCYWKYDEWAAPVCIFEDMQKAQRCFEDEKGMKKFLCKTVINNE